MNVMLCDSFRTKYKTSSFRSYAYCLLSAACTQISIFTGIFLVSVRSLVREVALISGFIIPVSKVVDIKYCLHWLV